MKKTILILSLATFFVACGSETDKKEEGKEKTEAKSPETVKVETTVNTNDVANTQASTSDMGATTISFDKMEHDFGAIPKDSKVNTVFTLTNTGETPLLISDAKGSCGCTVPTYPKTPVAPGETAEIEVVFDSTNKSGDVSKTVTILANTEPSSTVLTIKGIIQK